MRERTQLRILKRRLQILEILRSGPISMSKLMEKIDYTKPTIINDIKCLRDEGHNIEYDSSMNIYRLNK